MPDLIMKVDTALGEVPVNVAPLIDDTDFKTIEDAVAYNAGGMALNWHFVTTGGAYSVTAVTPTTGGDYDWTDQGTAGIYTIEIPASGGASINNDTEGFGWFTGKATGVLPWRGPTIAFVPANVADALINGSDYLQTDMVQLLGVAPEVSTDPLPANVLQINDSTTAAENLSVSADTMVQGTVDNTGFSPPSTVFEADDITEATSSHFIGRTVIFVTGALAKQQREITAYTLETGRGHFTVDGLTEAPANNDTFIIV